MPHQHINVTYILQADEKEALHVKEDENEGVKWIPVKNYKEYSKEETMYPIYDKILAKVANKEI